MIPSNAPEKDFLDEDDEQPASPSGHSAPDHTDGKPSPPRAVRWSYTAGFNNSYRLSAWHLEGRTRCRTLCGQKTGIMAERCSIGNIQGRFLCRRCTAAMTGRRDLNHRYSPVI